MATLFGLSLPLLLVILGVGLSISEALAPGAHFVVLGVALIVAGLVGLLVPVLDGPLALAALVLAAGAVSFYIYREFDFYQGSGTGATTDSDSLQGRSGRVTERVTETGGEIKLDDGGFNPYYSARTIDGDIPEGTEVMVVDPGGGNVLTVEALDVVEDDIDRELARGRERESPSGSAESGSRASEGEPETEGV